MCSTNHRLGVLPKGSEPACLWLDGEIPGLENNWCVVVCECRHKDVAMGFQKSRGQSEAN